MGNALVYKFIYIARVMPWIRNNQIGHYENVYLEWRESDPDRHLMYLRMYPEDFKNLLDVIKPQIEKQDTVMRASIRADKRLTITLRYLATGKIFINYLSLYIINSF